MAHLKFRNVNDAFSSLVHVFAHKDSQHRRIPHSTLPIASVQTRNGPVWQIMEPVITTYEKPCERVLFNQARDCNVFFHLYEALWMLAGRNDVAPLDYYLGGRYSQFSDDKTTANGAYGYRWRKANPHQHWKTSSEQEMQYTDQLAVIIAHLKKKPEDRRCVLQMWNVQDDLLKMETSRDVCCNLCALFLLRDRGEPWPAMEGSPRHVLDMTVMNRSNDLANGMLGANVVHFSFLQEYMAAHLGVEVGVYNQISNNLHVYTESFGGFPAEKWLEEYRSPETSTATWYTDDATNMVPLVKDPATFDQELPEFVQIHGTGDEVTMQQEQFLESLTEPFLEHVAHPMLMAFHAHKCRFYTDALKWIDLVRADDWREAGLNWITKRKENWEAKRVAERS